MNDPTNLFAPAESIREVLGQAIGAGSMCWDSIPTGVFDSTRAEEVIDDALTRVRELLTAAAEQTAT